MDNNVHIITMSARARRSVNNELFGRNGWVVRWGWPVRYDTNLRRQIYAKKHLKYKRKEDVGMGEKMVEYEHTVDTIAMQNVYIHT